MEIRRIQATEGLQLQELRLRALADAPEAFGSTLAEMQQQPEEYWHGRAASTSAGERASMFIAIEAGRWLGMVGGYVDGERPDTIELVSLWVDPAFRGRGVGRSLMEAVIAWAREQRASRLGLWVTQTNAAAAGLYTSMGFRPTGKTQPHPSRAGLVEMEMAKPLLSSG